MGSQKVLIPALHVKLDLMRRLVKTLDKESAAEKCLTKPLPEAIRGKGQSRCHRRVRYREFSREEKAASDSFVVRARGFLGNRKAKNYADCDSLVKNCGKWDAGCSSKPISSLTFILLNSRRIGTYSKEVYVDLEKTLLNL